MTKEEAEKHYAVPGQAKNKYDHKKAVACCYNCCFAHDIEIGDTKLDPSKQTLEVFIEMHEGECRRNSPQVVATTEDVLTYFPDVSGEDWCGQFVPLIEPRT